MSQQGPKWAFMQWLKLNNPDGSKYLDRLRIVQTPWFGLYLHWIYSPDDGRDLHDHPWWFASFLLKGQYVEECMVPWRDQRHGPVGDESAVIRTHTDLFGVVRPVGVVWSRSIKWLNIKAATGLHRITYMTRSPVVSLVFVGPRVREWGFVQADGSWIRAEDYHIRGDGSIKVG